MVRRWVHRKRMEGERAEVVERGLPSCDLETPVATMSKINANFDNRLEMLYTRMKLQQRSRFFSHLYRTKMLRKTDMEKEKVRHPYHIRYSWSVTGEPGNIVATRTYSIKINFRIQENAHFVAFLVRKGEKEKDDREEGQQWDTREKRDRGENKTEIDEVKGAGQREAEKGEARGEVLLR
ncbi:hypothetical protein ALC62_11737 [Cyphomyrmex costatus]|uniref:Uncharacterized protein n=1 Tax=Cyphomyrmex costatus TaxID=456900 RepID=A0A195C9Q6_9HYME|nr:hypothetical protein ALC62_11737 [Cyphomyrmex costatus]